MRRAIPVALLLALPVAGRGVASAVEAPRTRVETKFVQVHPPEIAFGRSPDETLAVLLIHGFRPHPVSARHTRRAELQEWQEPGSRLVETLGTEADVFAFAYGQTVAVEQVAALPELRDAVERLRALGFSEIALVGHSAGGLIARHFVEEFPDSPVTAVIQVCSPNRGAPIAHANPNLHHAQGSFLHSLETGARAIYLRERAGKRIPDHVKFVCVIGDGGGAGDFVVSDDTQWPPDLRAQGIPAIQLRTLHFTVMRSRRAAERIAELLRSEQPRWTPEEVEEARRRFLRNWLQNRREEWRRDPHRQ